VCIIDTSGHIIQSYGEFQESGVGKFNYQHQLAVDIHDNVLVADRWNNRVQFLGPTLTDLGDIEIHGHQLNDPYTVHFNELNHRLYVGEWRGGRIFVLNNE